jgi:sulfotransferase family protein
VRPPVLIIGAHRSGTTATARALELLGLQLGQKLDSHHESKPMQRLQENYLRSHHASWHHPQPFIDISNNATSEEECAAFFRAATKARFSQLFGYRQNPRGWWLRRRLKRGQPWGWKEPRTTLFVPAWLRVFPGARIIHVVRHPLAVALSIRQREFRFRESGDPPTPDLDRLDYCLRLALTYVALGDAVRQLTPDYFWLRFESLQNAPRETLRELAEFCHLQPSQPQTVRAAASIRPSSPRSGALSAADIEAVRPMQDSLRALGYDLPTD